MSNSLESATFPLNGTSTSLDLFWHGLEQAEQEDVNVIWPTLDQLGLSPSARDARRMAVGGSDANIILSGDPNRIKRLWQEKRGQLSAEDLSDVLPVMMGQWTEVFNRHWYEKITSQCVTAVGGVFQCPSNAWRRCTVDGLVANGSAIWEAKHTSAFAKPEEVLERYMPQLQHNMAVVQTDRAVLSVLFGNHRFEIFEVASDWLYQRDLLKAEQGFWDCVLTGEEPVPPPIPAPPRPVGIREVCLEGNNAWSAAAADWLQTREAAKLHTTAVAAIKTLVEPDVARAFGHGIEVKRSKAGALSVREFAQ